jgi:hypothetical protein
VLTSGDARLGISSPSASQLRGVKGESLKDGDGDGDDLFDLRGSELDISLKLKLPESVPKLVLALDNEATSKMEPTVEVADPTVELFEGRFEGRLGHETALLGDELLE